jgi:hypothetical protein
MRNSKLLIGLIDQERKKHHEPLIDDPSFPRSVGIGGGLPQEEAVAIVGMPNENATCSARICDDVGANSQQMAEGP